jgi:sulfotransferase family protein
VTFEATPEYLYYPRVASRLHEYDPDLKLIVLLREPAARAISAWNMYRDLRLNHPDYLRSLLPECDEGARAMINAMLDSESFPDADQAMRTEADAILSGTAALDPGYVQRGLYRQQLERYFRYFDRRQIAIVESSRLKAQPKAVLDELVRFLELRPHAWHNTELLLHHVGEYGAPIHAETREFLREFFRPHNHRLYELLGRDLGWDRAPD